MIIVRKMSKIYIYFLTFGLLTAIIYFLLHQISLGVFFNLPQACDVSTFVILPTWHDSSEKLKNLLRKHQMKYSTVEGRRMYLP